MFPSKKSPNYGVFVENFKTQMEDLGVSFPYNVLIKGKASNVVEKLYAYLKFAFLILYKGVFGKYDLIYVHQVSHSAPFLWLLLRFIRIKYVLNFHGDDAVIKSFTDKLLLMFSKANVKRANLVVVPSKYFKEKVLDLFDIDESRIYVSPSGGINSNIFKPSSEFPKSLQSDNLKLINVGRIDEGKGLDILLLALKNCYAFIGQLKIIGSGPLENELINEVIRLGISDKVIFIPMLNHKDLIPHLQSSDLFIFPSERESLGLVGLEAMACGLPVVGSDIGGISSYLTNDFNGLLFRVNDYKDLAEKILIFHGKNATEKKRLGINALETSRAFKREIVADNLHSRLIRLMGNGS